MADDDRRDERRPDPDALLALAEKDRRGKLTVFLGAAPGVGKTYAILSRAQRLKADGIDVVFGTSSFLRQFSHGKDIPYIIDSAIEVIEFIKRQGLEVIGELKRKRTDRGVPCGDSVATTACSGPAWMTSPILNGRVTTSRLKASMKLLLPALRSSSVCASTTVRLKSWKLLASACMEAGLTMP